MKDIPFDFESTLKIPDWNKEFKSSLCEDEVENFFSQQEFKVIKYISQLEAGKNRNILLLSLPFIMSRFNGLLTATMALEKSLNNNINFVSKIPEFNFLKTGDIKYLNSETNHLLAEKPLKTALLRRIFRTLSWSKWYKIFNILINPDVIAVGHNSVLIKKAKSSDKKIYFYQANEIIEKAKSPYNALEIPDYLFSMCEDIYTLLLYKKKILNPFKERFDILIKRYIQKVIVNNFHALEACYQYRKMPKNIWIGTGGSYSFRLLALSVLHNGGKVTGFSHSTTPVMSPSKENVLLNELSVVSDFVCISPKARDIISNIRIKNINPKIHCIDGEPCFKGYSYSSYRTTANKRPTIIYVSAPIRDINKNPIFCNSMVYLEWQLRLTKMLDKMDIDLICQPHPGGIFSNRLLTHPLREKYDLPYRSFEDIKEQADMFLIDSIYSTVVGRMLITDKPIVRISFMDSSNYYGLRDDNKNMINNRCRLIKASFNKDDNLPYVDFKELERLLTRNWKERVDSTEFKELLIGG